MLNNTHFVLLAGRPENFDNELRQRIAMGDSITEVQMGQFNSGRRSAQIVRLTQGWAVVPASSLMDTGIMFSPADPGDYGIGECLEWGMAWANEDPYNRELYIRK